MMRVNPRKAEKNSSSLLSSFMQLVEKNVLCISRSTVILLKATQTQQGWAERSELESQPGSLLSSSLNGTSCPGKKKWLSNIVGLFLELSLW